ncbi:uncharacterized protein LOC132189224 [Corylus avellana]|uniref:uncharacterized protein LOC132189224 n=1 Tax=Corylus avellana TaxID=13451 RepID=UPI00286C8558|nr:uncharacterized protein LOC132189224 [Corylus avellana]
MSLVDYASSSDDDVSESGEDHQNDPEEAPNDNPQLPVSPQNQVSLTPSNQQPQSTSVESSEQPIGRLPDASFLLNSPAMSSSLLNNSDHSSRVAAAMAENASRKRDSNGSASALLPRRKVPRGTLPHSRNVPDTVRGVLVPPQLSGRSNVVTEDIGKLFVRKHAEPEP